MHLPDGWPWIAAALVFLGLRLVGAPGRVIGVWAFKFVLGGASLWAVDILGAHQGVHLGVNPVTAAVVAYLGVPGLLLVAGTHVILTGSLH